VKKTFIENLSKKFWKNFWRKIPPFRVVLEVYPEIMVYNPENFRIRKFDYKGGMYYLCGL